MTSHDKFLGLRLFINALIRLEFKNAPTFIATEPSRPLSHVPHAREFREGICYMRILKIGPQNNLVQQYAGEYINSWKSLLRLIAAVELGGWSKWNLFLLQGGKSCRTEGQYNPAQKPNVTVVCREGSCSPRTTNRSSISCPPLHLLLTLQTKCQLQRMPALLLGNTAFIGFASKKNGYTGVN